METEPLLMLLDTMKKSMKSGDKTDFTSFFTSLGGLKKSFKIIYPIVINRVYHIEAYYCYDFYSQSHFQLVNNNNVFSVNNGFKYIESYYKQMIQQYEDQSATWILFYMMMKTDGVLEDVFTHIVSYYVPMQYEQTRAMAMTEMDQIGSLVMSLLNKSMG